MAGRCPFDAGVVLQQGGVALLQAVVLDAGHACHQPCPYGAAAFALLAGRGGGCLGCGRVPVRALLVAVFAFVIQAVVQKLAFTFTVVALGNGDPARALAAVTRWRGLGAAVKVSPRAPLVLGDLFPHLADGADAFGDWGQCGGDCFCCADRCNTNDHVPIGGAQPAFDQHGGVEVLARVIAFGGAKALEHFQGDGGHVGGHGGVGGAIGAGVPCCSCFGEQLAHAVAGFESSSGWKCLHQMR